MKNIILIIVAFSLSFLSFLWFIKNTDWDVTLKAINYVDQSEIIFLFFLYITSFLLKVVRFNFFQNSIQKSKLKVLFEAICLNYIVNILMPLRLGEVTRIVYLKKKINFSALSSLVVITAEKFFDILIIIIILFVLNISEFTPSLYNVLMPDFLIKLSIQKNFIPIFICIIVLSIFIVFYRRYIFDVIQVIIDYIKKIKGINLIVKSPETLFKIFLISVLIWFFEGLVFYNAASYLKLENPLILGFLSLCFVAFSTAVPSSPGGVGVFEASVVFAVLMLGENLSVGLSLAIIVHSVQIFSVILITSLVFLFTKILLK